MLNINAQGNYLQTIKQWQNQPDSVEKFKALAKIYDETGFDRQAIYYYQKAIQIQPDTKLLNHLAKVLTRYGKVFEAIKIRKRIDQLDKTDYHNKYLLATLYAQTGKKDTAIVLLQKLSKIDTLNPNYPYKIGIYSNKMNQKLDAFLEAYRRDPQHKKTLMMLIKNYKRIKFPDSSDYYLHKALKIYPYDTKFLRQNVIATYRKKAYQTMLKTLKKLDSLHYDDVLFIKKNTGLAYLMLHKYQDAETILHQALNLDAHDPILYYYLGKVCQATGRLKQAKKYFLTAIWIKKPKVDKEYFELGMIAKSQKHYKTALNYFKKSFENNHKNSDALLQMAMLSETVLQQPEKALQYYEDYQSRFAPGNKEQMRFVKSRIKDLKQKLFLKKR